MKYIGSKALSALIFATALVLFTNAVHEDRPHYEKLGEVQPAEMKVLKGTASSDDIALIQTKNDSGIDFLPFPDTKAVINIICNIDEGVDTSEVDMFRITANMKWTWELDEDTGDALQRVKIKIRNFNTGKWTLLKSSDWTNQDDPTQFSRLKREWKNFESFDDYVNPAGNVLLRVNTLEKKKPEGEVWQDNEGGFSIDNIRLDLTKEILY